MANNGLQMNEITEKTKKSFVTRTITALVLVAVCVPCLVLGNWFFAVLLLVTSVLATYEFIHVLKSKHHPLWIDVVTFIMTLSFIFWIPLKGLIYEGLSLATPSNPTEFMITDGVFRMSDIGISTLGFAVLVFTLFLASMLTSRFDVSDACYYFTMSLYLSLAFQAAYFLRYAPMAARLSDGTYFDYDGNKYLSCFLFIYVALGSFGSDIGAYCFGVLFGKHKMNPRISPNKTWEGFWGGVFLSFIASFALGIGLSAGGIPLLYGVFDLKHWYWILLISLVMPVFSVLGDFIFSAIKRYFGIKDFSRILPGHGGILDRIDSLLTTSLTATILILTIQFLTYIFQNMSF